MFIILFSQRTVGAKKSAGLCDLGLATKVHKKHGDEREAFTQGVGTNKYMAPECAGGRYYSLAADVYSLAVTCWEVCNAACRLRTDLDKTFQRLVIKGTDSAQLYSVFPCTSGQGSGSKFSYF